MFHESAVRIEMSSHYLIQHVDVRSHIWSSKKDLLENLQVGPFSYGSTHENKRSQAEELNSLFATLSIYNG